MSFTKVAPAGIGTSPGNSILIGDSLLHSTGIDIGSNTGIGVTIRKHGDATFTGIITASAFFGDGSGLEGVSSSGIGTPLSDDDTSDLNKVYYVNQELSIGSTVTVNHPSSAVASYTHYQDLVVTDDADFIVSDGDTFIPDVLGIRTSTSTASAATGGRIRAGTITNAGANGAPNFPNGLTGTAGTFTGAINAASGTITGNLGVGGVLTYEDVTNVDSVGLITARLGINLVGNDLNVGSNIKIGNASGIITATSYRGDGSALTGVGASFGNSSINTSGIITATAFVPTTGQLSNRNIIINGAMTVAQRASSTTSNGYGFVDRFQTNVSNLSTGGNVTRSQQSLSSSDTGPWQAGFRKYARMATVGAGTAAATSAIDFYTHIEAQDMANSGWDYTSSSGKITLSFWFRCSANQTFYTYLRSRDGTQQGYVFAFTASGNNTWTKITHTIPGNSNITFDDNNGTGLSIYWIAYYGTDYTNNKTLNTWAAHSGSNTSPDMATTWLTSGAATWDITGIQLEVGPVATPFEHRSFGDELLRCQRYYYQNTAHLYLCNYGSNAINNMFHPVQMRATPTVSETTTSGNLTSISQITNLSCYYYAASVSGSAGTGIKAEAEL